MKRKLTALVALLLTVSLALAACSNQTGGTSTPAPAATPTPAASSGGDTTPSGGSNSSSHDYGSVKFLRMCSGTQGATWTTVGSAMMEYANADLGISASCSPGGAAANVRSVSSKEYELGWTFTSTAYEAYTGTGAYAEEGAMENLTHIMSIFPSVQHLVVPADSSIQSLNDVNGKIYNFGPATDTMYTANVRILNAYGIDQNTIESAGGTVTMTRFNEAAELLKNNELDVWTALIAFPGSAVSDMAFAPGIRLLSIDEDKIPAILETMPGFEKMTIPGGTYEGVDEDAVTVGTVGSIVCAADLPEDVVYDFLQSMYNNWDKLKAINPTAFGELDVSNWMDGSAIPLHPGAERFYKDMGLM